MAPATLISYLPIVRRFLTAHFGNKALRLQDLQPQDLQRFILRQVARGSTRPIRELMVTATALESCASLMPAAEASRLTWLIRLRSEAHWRLSHLPRSRSRQTRLRAILRCCDRGTASRAQRITRSCCSLASRAVCSVRRSAEPLTLDDLRLGRGEIFAARQRSRRLERLPFAQRCRHAPVHYRAVRPTCCDTKVVIRLKAAAPADWCRR